MTFFVPLFKYPFNGLHLYISTHIGPQGMSYQWSIKNKSVIGVVIGLNRVKQWEYTTSPLYGPIFFTTPIYIEMPRALHRHFYWVSMYRIYVCNEGSEMDWRHCRPKLWGFVRNTCTSSIRLCRSLMKRSMHILQVLHRYSYWVPMYRIWVCDEGSDMDWGYSCPK